MPLLNYQLQAKRTTNYQLETKVLSIPIKSPRHPTLIPIISSQNSKITKN